MEWLGLVTVSVCLIVSDCFLWTDQICFLLGPEITLYSNMSGIVLIRFTSRRTSDGLWPVTKGGEGEIEAVMKMWRLCVRMTGMMRLTCCLPSSSLRVRGLASDQPRSHEPPTTSQPRNLTDALSLSCQFVRDLRVSGTRVSCCDDERLRLASEMSGHSDLPWPRVTWPRSWVWPWSSWGWRGWVAPTTPPPTMPTPRGSLAAQVGIME